VTLDAPGIGPLVAVAASDASAPARPPAEPVDEVYRTTWALFRPTPTGFDSLDVGPHLLGIVDTTPCLGEVLTMVGGHLFVSADCRAAFVDLPRAFARARPLSRQSR
jgi:hypothetical protein